MVKQKYRKERSRVIASYSYTDIAEGRGRVIFFGSDTEDNGTTTYQLLENPTYSANLLTLGSGATGGTDEKILDIDFDVTFNMPKRIKGKIIANIPVITGHETTTGLSTKAYAILKVRHWDGSSETEIASNTKSLISQGYTNLDTDQIVFNVEVNVSAGRHFKKGETLRLTVEIWKDIAAVNGANLALMHDPKNRTPDSGDYAGGIDAGEFITSILSFDVPFVLTNI